MPLWLGIEKGPQRSQWINLKGEWVVVVEIGNDTLCCLAIGQIVQWWILELLTSSIELCKKDILAKEECSNWQCHRAVELLTETLQEDWKPVEVGIKKYCPLDSLAKRIVVQVRGFWIKRYCPRSMRQQKICLRRELIDIKL